MILRPMLISVVIVIVPLLAGCGSQESVASSLAKIDWQSYDAGLRQAAESGKKVFLYFRADW